MKKFLTKLSIWGVLLLTFDAFSQDVQFSQFYAVPLYQNPAFAGSAHTTRAMFHQRLQWPRLDGKYITSLASVDHYFADYRSGVGLSVMKDWQGSNTISSTSVVGYYSYEIYLSSRITVRTGLSAAYVNRTIDYAQLRFPSQHNDTIGYIAGSNSPLGTSSPVVRYPDLGAGGILYTDKLWFGFSADHVNVPNQSFIKNVSRLPIKASFTGGYKIILQKKKNSAYLEESKEVSITPTFHYKFQGKSDQLDLGIYGMYGEFLGGFWYRGIPLKKYRSGIQNNESVIILAGYKMKRFAVSYSYDVTISRLGKYQTGGAHEINLTYFHHKINRKKKPMKRLPCPQFYKH